MGANESIPGRADSLPSAKEVLFRGVPYAIGGFVFLLGAGLYTTFLVETITQGNYNPFSMYVGAFLMLFPLGCAKAVQMYRSDGA